MLKSHELLGFMSPELANDILNYAFESDKPTYKAVLNGIAEARKVRPVFLERQARSQRHALMVATLSRPGLDQVASSLIRAWLVKKQQAMLVDFLNALEIPNNEGVIDDLPKTVDDAKLKAAIENILAKHPPEVVAVYLNAFNDMNEASWANLNTMLEGDSRLQVGGHA
jgi:pantothenate synthetase